MLAHDKMFLQKELGGYGIVDSQKMDMYNVYTVAVNENVACICTCSIRPRRSSAAFSMSFDSCVY